MKITYFALFFFYQLGIPRHYMAQIQGQLAITGLPWCNFLAVCKNSKEIMLKKVYFHSEYWNNAVKILKQFCYALQVSLDPVMVLYSLICKVPVLHIHEKLCRIFHEKRFS